MWECSLAEKLIASWSPVPIPGSELESGLGAGLTKLPTPASTVLGKEMGGRLGDQIFLALPREPGEREEEEREVVKTSGPKHF